MNYIDIFILIILGLAAVRGFSKGLIVELFSFVAFFFGIFAALEFAAPVANALAEGSAWYGLVLVGVFVLLFFVLSFVVNFLAKVIRKAVQLILLGWLDSLLGSAIGVIKWAFILSVILWVMTAVGFQLPSRDLDRSMFYSYVAGIGPGAFDLIQTLLPFLDEFRELRERNGGIDHFV